MRRLFALLLFQQHNLHMLHWKASGKNFQKTHEFIDEMYNEMIKHLDTVAEIMLQHDYMPLTFPEVYEELANNDKEFFVISPNNNYSDEEVFKILQVIFRNIIDEIQEVKNEGELPDYHKSELDTLQSYYSLKANYLFKQRLND